MKPLKKTKGVSKKQVDFLGRGVASPLSGRTPNETGPMGFYYGTGMKNPMGRMRSSSIGYRPVSKKQLGTPPKSVV